MFASLEGALVVNCADASPGALAWADGVAVSASVFASAGALVVNCADASPGALLAWADGVAVSASEYEVHFMWWSLFPLAFGNVPSMRTPSIASVATTAMQVPDRIDIGFFSRDCFVPMQFATRGRMTDAQRNHGSQTSSCWSHAAEFRRKKAHGREQHISYIAKTENLISRAVESYTTVCVSVWIPARKADGQSRHRGSAIAPIPLLSLR